MKKNGEYVGVDEKFIPENEKYVDESLLGDKEKAKKTAKKIAKGYLIFFVIFMVFAISMPIFMYMRLNNRQDKFNDMQDKFNDMRDKFYSEIGNMYTFNHLSGGIWGSELRDNLDKIITNNKLDGYADITVVYNNKSAITPEEILIIKNEIADINSEIYEVTVDYADSFGQVVNKIIIKDKVIEQSASSFNFNIKDIEGEKYGSDWRLDNVIKSNKNNDKHIIKVVYKENTYVSEDEIIILKRILDDGKKYQYSLDYDEKGYINKITIKDI